MRLPVSCLVFEGPRSYTGQDSAEILTVGNPSVLSRVLARLIGAGARQAAPGEFSARAYLAGKLTVQQAESIGARIAAERDEELEAADRVRSGAFGARCAAWAERLAGLLALVEAGIDFTDEEDVVAISPAALRDGLATLHAQIRETLGPLGAAEAATHHPVAVLVGPPNAGKSTLFNALLGRRRVVTSDTAGTTRDAIAEDLRLADGLATVRLVDLPGLDNAIARGGPDAEAQDAAQRAIRTADLLIACDPAGRFGSVAALDAERPIIRVRTKADLLGAGEPGTELAVCALDGWRLEALRKAISDAAVRGSAGDAVVPRHRRALTAALSVLEQTIGEIALHSESLGEPEMIASALRDALDDIGAVAGHISPDDVLGRVFASFCIGK